MHGANWTDDEIAILRERRRANIKVPAIARELGRTVGAVYARARIVDELVMDRKVWSDDETLELERLFRDGETIVAIGIALDRNEGSLRWKLGELGLIGERVRYWTEAEEARLAELVDGRSMADLDLAAIAVGLAGITGGAPRAETAVAARIRELGLAGSAYMAWTDDLTAALAKAVEDDTLAALAEATGRKLDTLRARASGLGLLKGAGTSYTDAEEARIRATEGDMDTLRLLAVELGRSERGVIVHAQAMGVVKPRPSRVLTAEKREAILAAARAGVPVTKAALELGSDPRVLARVAAEAGLVFAKAERVKAPPKPRVSRARVEKPVPVHARSVEAPPPALAAARNLVDQEKPVAKKPVAKRSVVPKREPVAPKPVARKVAKPKLVVLRPVEAPPPPRVKKVCVTTSTGFKWVVPQPARDMSAEIAAYLARNEVTRETLTPEERVIRALRGKGYSIVAAERGWVVDGHKEIANSKQLFEFARIRGVDSEEQAVEDHSFAKDYGDKNVAVA